MAALSALTSKALGSLLLFSSGCHQSAESEAPPKSTAPEAAPEFANFPNLPPEIRHTIWQLAQPQRILQITIDENNDEAVLERPCLVPATVSKVCYEARQETYRTFSVIPRGIELCFPPEVSSELCISADLRDCIRLPRKLQDRVAWFEPQRDIIFWNGMCCSETLWEHIDTADWEGSSQVVEGADKGALEKTTKSSEVPTRSLEGFDKRSVKHVMVRADRFSHGFWDLVEILKLFPNIELISVLVGGISIYETKTQEIQRPLCALLDLKNKAQKRRVSRFMNRFPESDRLTWKRLQRHSRIIHGVADPRGDSTSWADWDLLSVQYHEHCRSVEEWKGDIESFKNEFLAYVWQRRQKSPKKNFAAWKQDVLDSLPHFRQVLFVRAYGEASRSLGLEEVTI
ncbi:hypothetical protein JX266_000869 [Neoarthrinium moseri]|nr:hypothetical protein JX266_000869 [Neoarthrinium moseri]